MTAALELEPGAIIILGVFVACAVAFVAVCALGDLVGYLRRRRARQVDELTVRRRIDDLRTMPAPDELPRARDLTPGEVRQLRGRKHPVPRKRGSRRWGA